MIAQPVIGQPVGGGFGAAYGPGIPSGALGRWLTDPFDAWCSSGDVCCTSTFCICIPLGWAADEVGQDGNFVRCLSGGFAFINLITEGPLVFSFWPWCCFLKMCAMTGNATLITATRARTSTRDHIPIDSCDSGFSFCCGPCAVAQMTVHNQRRQALALAEAGGIQGSAAVAHEPPPQQRELRAQLDARDARSLRQAPCRRLAGPPRMRACGHGQDRCQVHRFELGVCDDAPRAFCRHFHARPPPARTRPKPTRPGYLRGSPRERRALHLRARFRVRALGRVVGLAWRRRRAPPRPAAFG